MARTRKRPRKPAASGLTNPRVCIIIRGSRSTGTDAREERSPRGETRGNRCPREQKPARVEIRRGSAPIRPFFHSAPFGACTDRVSRLATVPRRLPDSAGTGIRSRAFLAAHAFCVACRCMSRVRCLQAAQLRYPRTTVRLFPVEFAMRVREKTRFWAEPVLFSRKTRRNWLVYENFETVYPKIAVLFD